MSVRTEQKNDGVADVNAFLNNTSMQETALAEGNSYATASPDNPLKRQLVVSIRASLNELCLQSSKGTWSPSPAALKSIFQQKKL